MSVKVSRRGPLFDGRAQQAVDEFGEDAQTEVAREGERRVRAELGRVLRQPTGRYESRITVDRSSGAARVTDSGVVYGPWLEGVSNRNATTRFKGYATFRRVTQALEADAGPIAERVLPPHLKAMEG